MAAWMDAHGQRDVSGDEVVDCSDSTSVVGTEHPPDREVSVSLYLTFLSKKQASTNLVMSSSQAFFISAVFLALNEGGQALGMAILRWTACLLKVLMKSFRAPITWGPKPVTSMSFGGEASETTALAGAVGMGTSLADLSTSMLMTLDIGTVVAVSDDELLAEAPGPSVTLGGELDCLEPSLSSRRLSSTGSYCSSRSFMSSELMDTAGDSTSLSESSSGMFAYLDMPGTKSKEKLKQWFIRHG
jgi:hypothetical protein